MRSSSPGLGPSPSPPERAQALALRTAFPRHHGSGRCCRRGGCCHPTQLPVSCRYLISLGASLEATTDDGETPSDLIDPEYKDLVELFEATTMG